MTKPLNPLKPGGSRFRWSAAELNVLRRDYPGQSTATVAAGLGLAINTVYNKAHTLGLHKSREFLSSAASGRLQREGHQGIHFRFKAGSKPWNMGMKGWRPEGCEATQFKPGSTPVNRQLIGALRINSDGQLDIKLYDGLRSWVQLHHYCWFLAHGSWPPQGWCIRFKDGDSHNPATKNMFLVTRAENMRLNSYHNTLPPEVARLIQLRGALTRQINRRSRAPTPEKSQ